MLRFNVQRDVYPKNQNRISIHPMLRFNELGLIHSKGLEAFQYILCYGSTCKKFKNILIHDISIHPMLRFNLISPCTQVKLLQFQYILCYGSTIKERPNIKKGVKFQYILCYGSTIGVM